MRAKPGFFFWAGVGYLSFLVLLAVIGPFVLPPPDKAMGAPFQGFFGVHLLGTDEQGRDILSRIASGARVSLMVGVVVQVIALTVGILMGTTAVFAPRWLALPVQRFTDAMFAFPDLLLAILIVGVFGSGVLPVIVALSVSAWPGVARLVKTQVVSLKERDYVFASQALGAKTPFIVVKHILPHLIGILLAVSMVDLAATILAESSLSFLGIGVQAPDPSWGSMINTARQNMSSHPEMLLAPCIFLSVTIFALNFVGDGLRKLTDPRGR